MIKRIDLHMHSTYSDGTCTPKEVMQLCAKQKLACVALTDHDTLEGFEKAKAEADKLDLELISGIEISVAFEPGSLHILGYFMDPKDEKLAHCLEDVQRSRKERNPKMIDRLNQLGLAMTLQDVEAAARAGDRTHQPKQIGRPHFAKALIEKGYVRNSNEAFKRYLGKGAAAYVDKWRLSSKDAIGAIRDAGGVASIAHPTTLGLEGDEFECAVKEMADDGLQAIEVYHSSHNPRQRSELLEVAKKFDLLATGGSDFHGDHKPGIHVGFLGRGISLEYDVIDDLRKKIVRL